MKKQTKAVLILFFAILSLIAGGAGLVMPLIPGFIFIGFGIMLLSIYSPRMRNWLESHTRRWPKLHALIEKMQVWADKSIGTV